MARTAAPNRLDRQRRAVRAVEAATAEIGGRMDGPAQKTARSLHALVLAGGKPSRAVADLLHGTWLGHPLHPVLTDVTIGAFVFASFFDGIGQASGDNRANWAADSLLRAGTLAALPTALAGVADYSTVQKNSAGKAGVHGLLNGASLALYLLSLNERRRGRRSRGVLLSTLALGANMASAWLGGHLVYRERVGIDHGEEFTGPEQWTPLLRSSELAEGDARRQEHDGKSVLLYRERQRVHAIGAVCSHAGGPLEQGEFAGCTVRCPWHDSVFDLRDGSIVHGPATSPQASFEVRERNGWIEIRGPGARGG